MVQGPLIPASDHSWTLGPWGQEAKLRAPSRSSWGCPAWDQPLAVRAAAQQGRALARAAAWAEASEEPQYPAPSSLLQAPSTWAPRWEPWPGLCAIEAAAPGVLESSARVHRGSGC